MLNYSFDPTTQSIEILNDDVYEQIIGDKYYEDKRNISWGFSKIYRDDSYDHV